MSPSPENELLWTRPQMLLSWGRVAFPGPPQGARCSWIVTSGPCLVTDVPLGASFDISALW